MVSSTASLQVEDEVESKRREAIGAAERVSFEAANISAVTCWREVQCTQQVGGMQERRKRKGKQRTTQSEEVVYRGHAVL